MRRLILVSSFLVVGAGASVAQDPPAAASATAAGADPTAPSAAGHVDVSKILSTNDAQKILGEPVKPPTPLNLETKDGYYSKCNYYSAKSVRSLLVRVREASEGSLDPLKEFEQVKASGGVMKPVDQLGDEAGLFSGMPENGLPPNVIMLYVVKGKFFITIGIGGMSNEATALDKAKEVARKILTQV